MRDYAEEFKDDIKAFQAATSQFYAGEMTVAQYKGISGGFGSYAQRGGKYGMLRLRLSGGEITKEHLRFITECIEKYSIGRIHFTTCQTVQFHDLKPDTICDLVTDAWRHGIITRGGGGDYPRNVMCPPLSGVERNEYFDVSPWAQAAGEYLMQFVTEEKMPRKLKAAFSSSPENITHATYRDLGFAATKNGKFDVYSAGGLGPNPRFGVKVAEGIEPEMILYYIKAMRLTFLAYGNYESRAKARTRYMQEALGGPEKYKAAFLEKLQEVLDSGEDLRIHAHAQPVTKKGNGETVSDRRVLKQKQDGLYTVTWHPAGGMPDAEAFCALSDYLQGVEAAEMRLSPDETAYIINLNAAEALKVLELAYDSAQSLFETSVSCIGASVCQAGVRDSQALLAACIQAVREAGIPDGALPQIHISGCPSSCGTHQTGVLGFRGGIKRQDGKPQPAFALYVNGCDEQGRETMGREAGTILETKIPEFLVKLGRAAAESGMDFEHWNKENPGALDAIAAEYTAEYA